MNWLADFEGPVLGPRRIRRRIRRRILRPIVPLSGLGEMDGISSFFKQVGNIISIPFRAARSVVTSVVSNITGSKQTSPATAAPIAATPVYAAPVYAAPAAPIAPTVVVTPAPPRIALPAAPIVPSAWTESAASQTVSQGASQPQEVSTSEAAAITELIAETGTVPVQAGKTYRLMTYWRATGRVANMMYVPAELLFDGSLVFTPRQNGYVTRRIVVQNQVFVELGLKE